MQPLQEAITQEEHNDVVAREEEEVRGGMSRWKAGLDGRKMLLAEQHLSAN